MSVWKMKKIFSRRDPLISLGASNVASNEKEPIKVWNFVTIFFDITFWRNFHATVLIFLTIYRWRKLLQKFVKSYCVICSGCQECTINKKEPTKVWCFIFRKFIYLCKQTHPENVKIEIKDKDFIRNVSKNLICIDMT